MKVLITLFAIITIATFHHAKADTNYLKECVDPDKEQNVNYWITKYEMKEVREVYQDRGFIATAYHKSNYILPDTPIGSLDTSYEADKTHSYYELVVIYKVDQIFPIRRTENQIQFFQFLEGHEAIIHTIDKDTREYKATELGPRANKFFHTVGPGDWFTVDLKQRGEETYVLMAVTVVRFGRADTPFEVPSRKYMLELFPEHVDLINRVSPD